MKELIKKLKKNGSKKVPVAKGGIVRNGSHCLCGSHCRCS